MYFICICPESMHSTPSSQIIECVIPPLILEPKEMNQMMVEELSYPRSNHQVKSFTGFWMVLELNITEDSVLPVEAEKEITIIEVIDEVSQDQGFEVHLPIEVETGVEEVA